jgi:Fe-S cluster assembly protein SufD
VDVGAILTGQGARSELNGLVIGDGRQHFDHHTVHDHRARHTWSNIDFKTALFKKSRSAYTGLIRIDEQSAGSEAYQENRNLLLSRKARADTIPELEILTDDVQCTHGATVAPVDDEQIFYLSSRGVPSSDAVRLIVEGFLKSTLESIPALLREITEPMISARFEEIYGGAK